MKNGVGGMVKIERQGSLKYLFVASFSYLSGIFFLIVLSEYGLLDEQSVLIGLHLTAAFSFYHYWRCEFWGSAKYDCFGSAMLLISIGFRLICAFDTILFDSRFDAWPLSLSVSSSLLSLHLKGEVVTFFGTLLMVATWCATISESFSRFSFLHTTTIVDNRLFRALYALGLLTQGLIRIIGADFGAFAQLIEMLNSLAVASIYFLANSYPRAKSWNRIGMAFALGAPLSFLAMSHGMKSEIFFPFVPFAILTWITFSGTLTRLGFVLVGIFALSAGQVYTGYVRSTSWNSLAPSYSTTDLIANTVANADADIAFFGFQSVMARINMTSTHAMTVALTERDGYIPFEIFSGIPASVIPRIIWPAKPILRPGAEHTQRIRGSVQNIEDVSSATAAGFFTELYMGGGIVGLLAVSILYGFLVARIQLSISTLLPESATLALSFLMYYNAVRFDENTIAYALTGLILSYVLMVVIFKLFALFHLTHVR